MTRPTLLLGCALCVLYSYGQKTDTLVFLYRPDQFILSLPDRHRLDSFLLNGWDRIFINGYTDETDDEEHNLQLSMKRSRQVYDYFLNKQMSGNAVSYQFFGESAPRGDNNTEEGRAQNRRTEVIGYRYARVQQRPAAEPMKPVTRMLDNGFMITYRPGGVPASFAANMEAGSGMNFQLVTTTNEMRQNNMYNNTTRGEVLSSVLIICGRDLNPCKLDSPLLVRVPIPFSTNCPIQKIKFFNTVAENGKRIWQEQSKQLYPEVINGRTYIRLWIDNFCECINFDFKLDPDCYDTDSAQLLLVNSRIKNFSVELNGFNSVYFPKKVNDSLYSVLFLKNKLNEAPISFSLYSGKRRVRGFKDKLISTLDYDESSRQYLIRIDTLKLYFPKVNVVDASIKVNRDKYRVAPEKKKYEFLYLKHQNEEILVDFSIVDSKDRLTTFKNLPIESLNFDEIKGCYVIDRDFIKALKLQQSVSAR